MWHWALLWLALLCCAPLQAQQGQQATALPASLRVMPGQAVQVAVDSAGSSFVLSPDGTPWMIRAASGIATNSVGSPNWSRMPGSFAQLRAGPQGSVWAIDAQDVAYVWRGSWWQGLRREVQDIAIGPDGEPTFLSTQGEITPTDQSAASDVMYKHAQAGFERIALDEHGLLWQWRADGVLRRFDGVAWQDIQDFKEVGLRDLSLGAGGAALAVTAQGAVMLRDPRSGRWQALAQPSAVQRGALSPWGGALYALASGQIVSSVQAQPIASVAQPKAALFTRLLTWRKMRGMAQTISVAADGTAVVLDRNQTAWRLNAQQQWTPLVGRFTQIAVAPSGKLWAIDTDGRLLRQEGVQWFDSQMFAQAVAIGAAQEVWAIDPVGQLGRYDAAQKRWLNVVTPGTVKAVSIGAGNVPWVVDAKGLVHQRIGERWQAIPGIEASSIGVGALGAVYATTQALQLYWLDRASLEWKPAAGAARTVVVGPGDQPWVIDEQYALLQSLGSEREQVQAIPLPGAISPQAPPALITIAPPAASSLPSLSKPLVYSSIGAGFRDVGIGADGTVFAAGAGGSLYCFANPTRQFQMAAAGTVSRVAVSGNGSPWVINGYGQLSYFDKSSWSVVPGISAQDVSVTADGIAFIAQAERAAVYRFDPSRRELLEVTQYATGIPLKAKRLAAWGNALWAVTPANQVLKCSGKECQLQQIHASDIAVGPEGSVFALDLNGSLHRYNPRTNAFFKVNGQGNSLAVGPQGLPWLVSVSGEVQSSGLFAVGNNAINPSNCGTKFAVAPVPQIPNPTAILIARDDALSLAAGASASILANDSLNSRAPSFDQVRVTLSNTTTGLRYERGQVIVAATAVPGSSLISGYTICAEPGGVPCATARIAVQVMGTPTPTPTVTITISASNDSATLSPGGTLNLLVNDSLNGSAPTSAQVNVSFTSQSPQITQAAGLLTLNASALMGTNHTASYRLCALPTGAPCSNTATVAISVPLGITISATPDSANLNPGSTLNLLGNDRFNGTVPTSAQVSVSFTSQSPQITQAGGVLTLNTAAALGSSHTASYRLCAAPSGTPCSNTVSVIINVPMGISANTDTATLSPGGTLNMLANDSLNGSAPTSGQVNVSFASLSPQLAQVGGLLSLNAAALPGASHTASYSICPAPANSPCSNTVSVVINVPVTVVANPDTYTFPLSLASGEGVHLNDSLNGIFIPPGSPSVSYTITSHADKFILYPNGFLVLLNLTAPQVGQTYAVGYRFCEAGVPTNCTHSTATVMISPDVSATADSATLSTGGTLNLLANDSLNGSAPTSAQVNVSFTSLSAQLTQVGGLLTLNPAAAPGSSHTASYRICALPGGSPCSNTVTVVISTPITAVAVADIVSNFPRNIFFGIGLHDNDTLNGVLVPPGAADVQYTLNNNTAIFTLSIDGYLELVDDVLTPPGTYNLTYTFCELGVPTNCSSATAQITVTVN